MSPQMSYLTLPTDNCLAASLRLPLKHPLRSRQKRIGAVGLMMDSSIYDMLDDIEGQFDEQGGGTLGTPTNGFEYTMDSQYAADYGAAEYYPDSNGPIENSGQDVQGLAFSTKSKTQSGAFPTEAYSGGEYQIGSGNLVQRATEGRGRLTLGPARYRQSDEEHYPRQQHRNLANVQAPATTQFIPREPLRDFSRSTYTSSLPPPATSSPGTVRSSPAQRALERRSSNNRSGTADQAKLRRPVEYRPPTIAHTSTAKPTQSRNSRTLSLPRAPRIVQGIQLIPTSHLPDRFSSIFPFPLFNAVQSKCFNSVYETNNNFVLSSPTGSGKTAILELAICRLVHGFRTGSYKIVYMAPTKSLCSERFRDWEAKFRTLDLQCLEMTGDSDARSLRNIAQASIIITTPEKWDSITRRWKDHAKLVALVKLLLIDEVHMLKDDRGPTLEAVVSRMKSVDSDLRIVALSATIPNSEDIAAWLGRDPVHQHLPAERERFGDEFRPVRLQRHVCGFQGNGNDFAFDSTLDKKLPEVIAKYSHKKPIMIFCGTRIGAQRTAELLAEWWNSRRNPNDRYWEAPRTALTSRNVELRDCLTAGVAFHHSSVDAEDRAVVERGFLDGNINVICCTSTLAMGVNLPCHLVILKNTVAYSSRNGMVEYSDLDIMQMLGRAGRPQFDSNAVAVIMTRTDKVEKYEKMVSGQEILESKLHLFLIEHLNAEIGLGTITDVNSATKWLTGTFLYTRMKANPNYYRLDKESSGSDIDGWFRHICSRDISLLQDHELIKGNTRLSATEFGDAMAKYCVQFESMKVFLSLPGRAKISELLSALAQAAEFKEIRLKSSEKALYRMINQSSSIRFPISVGIESSAHKISLIIQAMLSAVDYPEDERTKKIKHQFQTETNIVFSQLNRLIRCIADCQIYLQDSVATRNTLILANSVAAKAWEEGPYQMKQLDNIGPVAVRKLAGHGIRSIDMLENTEGHKIEMILGKRPPFGMKLLEQLKSFPKLWVELKLSGRPILKPGGGVRVNLKATVGMLNEKRISLWRKRPIWVMLVSETSDGHLVDFRRIRADQLEKAQDALFSVDLVHPAQIISCSVMCDEIVGTQREAFLNLKLPASAFRDVGDMDQFEPARRKSTKPIKANTGASRRPSSNTSKRHALNKAEEDEYDMDGIDDNDFLNATSLMHDEDGFADINSLTHAKPSSTQQRVSMGKRDQKNQIQPISGIDDAAEAQKLPNGNFACNHKCKDKTACKHRCCQEGTDKPPKGAKKPAAVLLMAAKPGHEAHKPSSDSKTQSKLQLLSSTQAKVRKPGIERLDLTSNGGDAASLKSAPATPGFYEARSVESTRQDRERKMLSISRIKPTHSYAKDTEPTLEFLQDEDFGIRQRSASDPNEDEPFILPVTSDQFGERADLDWDQEQRGEKEPAVSLKDSDQYDEVDLGDFDVVEANHAVNSLGPIENSTDTASRTFSGEAVLSDKPRASGEGRNSPTEEAIEPRIPCSPNATVQHGELANVTSAPFPASKLLSQTQFEEEINSPVERVRKRDSLFMRISSSEIGGCVAAPTGDRANKRYMSQGEAATVTNAALAKRLRLSSPGFRAQNPNNDADSGAQATVKDHDERKRKEEQGLKDWVLSMFGDVVEFEDD